MSVMRDANIVRELSAEGFIPSSATNVEIVMRVDALLTIRYCGSDEVIYERPLETDDLLKVARAFQRFYDALMVMS